MELVVELVAIDRFCIGNICAQFSPKQMVIDIDSYAPAGENRKSKVAQGDRRLTLLKIGM